MTVRIGWVLAMVAATGVPIRLPAFPGPTPDVSPLVRAPCYRFAVRRLIDSNSLFQFGGICALRRNS
jgi:hypothetical protein